MAINMNRKSYKYGKLTDGAIQYAPYYLQIGNRIYVNASATRYLPQGWKKIAKGEYPELSEEEYAAYTVVETYTEDESCIYVAYEKVLIEGLETE